MDATITTINLWRDNFMFKASDGVNAYLVRSGDDFTLIDTGFRTRGQQFMQALEQAGLQPGQLRLIVITHADMDHAGHAAAVRQAYGGRIGVHPGEAKAVRQANMWLSRKQQPPGIARLVLAIAGPLTRAEPFEPDLLLADGQNLNEFGFDARVLALPGHSQGSIGVLTAQGDLFCGDLLTNIDRPQAQSLVDDPADLQASLEKLNRCLYEKYIRATAHRSSSTSWL